MLIPQHKENEHGQRTAKKEQGSKETQEEADTGNLIHSHPEPTAATGSSRQLKAVTDGVQLCNQVQIALLMKTSKAPR